MGILNAGSRPSGARWGEIGVLIPSFLILLHILDLTTADSLSIVDLSTLETRVLRLGQERKQDKLPLGGGGGKCVYELVNLKHSFSYEVKISYPATIPSSFSLSLAKEGSASNLSFSRRRLLNTEKIIFKVGEENAQRITTDEVSFKALVLVTVEPEGVVAKAHVEEQEFVIYNIMLEEVRLGGIPVQAFWVGFLALGAVAVSMLAAQIFPSLLQAEKGKLKVIKQAVS